MKFSLFLGAGASMPLGFPDTSAFKKSLEQTMKQTINTSMFYMLQKSGYEDIENVLTAIDALTDLPSNPGHNLVNNTITIRYGYVQDESNLTSRTFDEIITEFSEYKEKIQDYIYKEYSWKNSAQEKLELYDSVFSILKQSDDGIHICTTNYDQAMEHYIDENVELNRVDGFVFDYATHKSLFQPDKFFDIQQNNNSNTIPCYLYKLHGSLNWVSYGDRIHLRETDESFNGRNFVIYPTLSPKNKDYERDPYATMFKKFIERIKRTDFFIIIGYSFRDDLINKKFKEFLRRDGTKMFVISPSAKENTAEMLGAEFSYINIDFRNEFPEWIRSYQKLRNGVYDDMSINLRNSTFRDRLYGYFRQLDISDNAKVYNLVGKLEEIDAAGTLGIIPLISDIARKNF